MSDPPRIPPELLRDAYRDVVLRSHPRLATLFLALALVVGACGSDGDDADDGSATTTSVPTSTTDAPGSDGESAAASTTTTTSTTVDTTVPTDATTTTTAAPGAPSGEIAGGTLTTDGGTTTEWSLTATATTLCFEADLTHPDSEVAERIGDGVSACLEPAGGLDDLDGGLSVDVGTVDGERTIGFLWGRVAPEVISLTIEHTDGSQTPIEILDGPTDVGLFAFVAEIASLPPVQDLDAVSGTQIEGSEPIRDFLRAGPTYPVVTPPPAPTQPDYPVS